MGRPGSGALPPPTARPLGGLPGPTTHWLWVRGGVWVWGPVTNPAARALSSWLCALWGRHEGAWGGASCLGVGRPGSGALPAPTARRLGGLPGPTTRWLWLRGGAGVGTRHQPHSARPFELALRAVGAAGGRPGGGASGLGVGRPGSGALPPPTARPLGGLPGPTTHWLWVRGDAGVGTSHQPHMPALLSWLCALWGRHEGARGGTSCLGVGRPGSGALPAPTARPLGGLPGPTTHWLWVRGGAGVGTGHQPHSARSFELVLRAVGAVRGRPGGGRLLPGCGASRVGRSPTPDCPPSGRAAGAWYPLAVGAGGRGRGDASPTPQRALLRAGFARCGGGMRVPAGGASCLGVGRPGSGALPPPTARPSGGLPGGCACACPAWPGRAGRVPGRVLVRLTFPLAFLASLFACSALPGLGLPCLWLLLGFLFLFFFVAFPLLPLAAPPLCPALRVFRPRVPWRLVPPPLFFSLPPLCAPRCLLLCVFSGLGCPGPWRLVAPPPFLFFVFFAPPPSCCLWRFLLSGCLWPLPPPPFFLFFFLSCCFFSCCASAVCVLGCRAVCSLSCPFVVLCGSSVLFLVAGVVGSWCRCLLLGVCWWLWLPGVVVWWCVSALVPVSGLAVAWRPPCGVPFPCAVSCGAVLPCGAVLWCPVFFFFVFLPAGGAGLLLFPVGSGLRAGSGSFLFLCSACAVLCWCACAVALCSVLSCPRFPLLSPGGSWWLLVLCLGGVLWCVPGCCAAPCCCPLCRLV